MLVGQNKKIIKRYNEHLICIRFRGHLTPYIHSPVFACETHTYIAS
jgi:hypothetical protein